MFSDTSSRTSLNTKLLGLEEDRSNKEQGGKENSTGMYVDKLQPTGLGPGTAVRSPSRYETIRLRIMCTSIGYVSLGSPSQYKMY